MDGLNKAILIGNLGADPELRFTQSNKAVLKMRIATTETHLTDGGEKRENTQWHNCVVWGKRAEALSKFLKKGSRVYVEGRTEHSSYDDKDGVKRYRTEVSVQNLILLGDGKRKSAGADDQGDPTDFDPSKFDQPTAGAAPASPPRPAATRPVIPQI